MDSEVVGRHALLFDDDAMAAFVNSDDALVEWNSLRIDRYDVRHLLPSPPPKRRRSCSSKTVLFDDSSLESQLNHERYLDLPLHPDLPDVEEDELRAVSPSYHNVALLYGVTDDYANKKKTEGEIETSGFLPSFPIPNNLLQSLPPTEKLHQIIARTALFVSNHGGQSEIILRVKQGNNPTFGFLMPGHHLHSYFRYLVQHIELLYSESDKKLQDEQKESSGNLKNSNGVDGALTLLGSVYGSGEEDEVDDIVKPERGVSHNSNYSSKTQADAAKTEPMSKNSIPSNRKKFLIVQNSLVTKSKSGTAKDVGEKSSLSSGAVDIAKNLTISMNSNIEPVTLEPPPELKRLINKLVELTLRNGKQFEETLVEQEKLHERFPFLVPSDQYHSYYLKVLQTSQVLKLNCKSSSSGKVGRLGHGLDKNDHAVEKNFSALACDMSLESDRKEKFTMVIGKSKKETQEAESNEAQNEWGIDASSAAAILQAATRGISNSNSRTSSVPSSSAYALNNREGVCPRDSSFPSRTDIEKSTQSKSCTVPLVVTPNIVGVGVNPEALLTKEQKLKAERLQRAKRFVAMLKNGQVSSTIGASRGSSLEPLVRSASEVNSNSKQGEGNLVPTHVDASSTAGEKPERNYFGEHNEQPSYRKYWSRSDLCENDDDGDGDGDGDGDRHDERNNPIETEEKHHHRRHHRSRSLSHGNEDGGRIKEGKDHKYFNLKECENGPKEEKNCDRNSSKKRHKRKHRARSYYPYESDDEEEPSKEYSKRSKLKHESHSQVEDESENKYRKDENQESTSKKHRKHSKKRHLSKRLQDEGDDFQETEEKQRSHDKGKHRQDKKTQSKRKHDASLSHNHHNHNNSGKYNEDERKELENSEIRENILSGDVIIPESCSDVVSHQSRAMSQSFDTAAVEVSGDLRAKIRAMLMSTLV